MTTHRISRGLILTISPRPIRLDALPIPGRQSLHHYRCALVSQRSGNAVEFWHSDVCEPGPDAVIRGLIERRAELDAPAPWEDLAITTTAARRITANERRIQRDLARVMGARAYTQTIGEMIP